VRRGTVLRGRADSKEKKPCIRSCARGGGDFGDRGEELFPRESKMKEASRENKLTSQKGKRRGKKYGHKGIRMTEGTSKGKIFVR